MIALLGINASYSHSSLSLRCLRSAVSQLPIEVLLREYSINDPETRIADDLIDMHPEMLGMSAYIWNIDIVLRLAERVKLACPETLILLGGPEVVACDESWMRSHPYVDLVLPGEGENGFFKLCMALLRNTDWKEVPGLWWRTPRGDIIYNYVAIRPERELTSSPYLGFDEDFTNRLVYYETARGCPFRCAYCLSSREGSVRYKPMDLVRRDLAFLARSGTDTVKLVDRTFNINEKRAQEILDYWISLDSTCCLHVEMVADIMSQQFLNYLLKLPPGRVQTEIGIQSTNARALQAVNRRMDWERTKGVIQELVAAGNIHVHLDLLAGLPYEDMNSLRRSFNQVYELKPHHLQLGFLKVLPGTLMKRLADEMGYRYTGYSPYEIVATPWLTAHELVRLHRLAQTLDRIYNEHEEWAGLSYMERLYGDPFAMWLDIAAKAEEKGMFSRSFKLEYWLYLLVHTVMSRYGQEEADKVEDIIRFDILKQAKHYRMPPPFHDMPLPEERWHEVLPFLRKCWPELDFLSLKEMKKRVVIQGFDYPPGEKGPSWIAFLYPPYDGLAQKALSTLSIKELGVG